MSTTLLFREDAYLTETTATVLSADEAGIVLGRTIFYAQGGGQPGDRGTLTLADGTVVPVTNTVYGADRSTALHQVPPGSPLPRRDETITLNLDWPLRLSRMKIHTALHLLSVVVPYPVSGGAIGDGEGRLDFDLPEASLDRDEIASKLQEMIDADAAVSDRWISDEELLANPGLVKTMSVKPPMGSGRVRLVSIEGIDLQPCGGTHVKRTGEIGRVLVTGIEKKGRQNRRVRIALG